MIAIFVSPVKLVLLTGGGLAFALAIQWSQRRATLQRLQMVLDSDAPLSPNSAVAALKWLGSHVPGASDTRLRTALTRAGYIQPAALPVFVALRLLCTGAVFLSVLFHQGAQIRAGAMLQASFMAFFISRLFVMALKARAEGRERQVRRELPPVVDILLMVLNSGVSIDQSLRYVTDLLGPTAPLVGSIFRRYVTDTDSGVPYETAFERMGQRLGIEEGHDLTALIKQSLLQGGEIAGSLERFGAELAEKRISYAREQIGRTSIILTIVMLVFFMPVLMIILAGPAVSNIFDTLGTVKQRIHTGDKMP